MIALEYFIPLASFGAVAAATYALLALFDPYWLRVHDRVEQLQKSDGSRLAGGASHSPAATATPGSIIDALQRLLPHRGDNRPQVQQRLAKAGIYHRAAVSRYYVAKLLMMIVAAAATAGIAASGYLQRDMSVLIVCVAGAFGSILPSLWLDRAINRNHILLRRSLPDFLDLVIVCLQGGLSLQETIRRVSDELQIAHPALAFELSIVQRDIELGATVDQALKRFATRTDYEGVRTLSTFIRETQRFGTNITEALRSHADMLRTQREQAAEERAQKAGVKILIPTLLLIFPAIFVVAVGPAVIQIQQAFAVK